ncbi:unnamed protein product [Cladocopium goreaui]|uniref:Reverse transcriptase Ty1/copia-type domain-containing protein n=1 Tax=Cladocopium goreaui TaxID=2562237 RepID=A0A9P1CWA0_9DINO|nr:unnamed protein product [Cladocopium goreaui]
MAVCALVSIDNFSRPIALHANWDGIWRGSRFLPPTERCFVVFQMGEELITVHQGLPVRSLQRPMAMPLWRQSPQVGAAVGSCTEVNVLRIGALAEAFCNGTEPACRGARVKCTAAQASFAQRGKVSEAHPRCPVAWTKAANI